MHTSSVANYALDVHLNRKSIKQTTPNTVSPIPVKPVVLICRRLFAIGRKQRQDLYFIHCLIFYNIENTNTELLMVHCAFYVLNRILLT